MVNVSIEVRSGVSRFDVGVQAESIQRAMSFVRERYPKDNVWVKFPIEPESFFVEDSTARIGIVGIYKPATTAA